MTASTLESGVEHNSVFAHLTEDDWHLLVSGATQKSFHRGEIILEQGSLECAIFMIRQGYVRVKSSQGRGITLAILGPGEVFGEMSFLERTGASASVLAEDDVTVDIVEEAHLQSLLTATPGFPTRFYRSLAESLSRRLRNTSQRLSQLSANQLLGPKRSLLLGNLIEFHRKPLEFVAQCARQYGDIVPLRFGFTPALLLTHPEHVDRVLKDRALFIRSTAHLILRTLAGGGLIVAEGDSWLRRRRLAQPAFHQHRVMGYGDIVTAYTERMLSTWKDGEVRDLSPDMAQLTLSIITKVLFNVDLNAGEARSIAEAMETVHRMNWIVRGLIFRISPMLSERFPTPSNIRYREVVQQMDNTIYQIIHQRRASRAEDPKDLLSILMQARDESDGSQMTDRQLRDEACSLMIAGYETTANSLCWTWMLLSRHREVQSRVLEEIQKAAGGRPLGAGDLDRLPYTCMVIKESIRLYPPIWMIVREAKQECEIGGYDVPAGCVVASSPWAMHRDPRFFDKPELFLPDRWANGLERQLPKGAYFPFGDGPHLCIGKGFAMMEILMILATAIAKFQFIPAPNHFSIPRGDVTLRPRNGVKVILKRL